MGGTEKKHPRGAGRKPGRPVCTFLKRSRARAPRPRGRPARVVGDVPHAAPPATRLPGPAAGRAAGAVLGLGRGKRVRLGWQDVPERVDGIGARALVMDLTGLSPGRYRVVLSVKPVEEPAVAASREIVVSKSPPVPP